VPLLCCCLLLLLPPQIIARIHAANPTVRRLINQLLVKVSE
jgi:hypothetical protein